MDVYWHLRCLNDHTDIPDMIGSCASEANASSLAKNGTKKIFPLLSIISSPVDIFWCLRCQNNCIDPPDTIGLIASGATSFLVAKIGTKDLATSCLVFRI